MKKISYQMQKLQGDVAAPKRAEVVSQKQRPSKLTDKFTSKGGIRYF